MALTAQWIYDRIPARLMVEATRSSVCLDKEGCQIWTPRRRCRLMIVQLWGVAGYGVDIRVVGYQFPDADDRAKRCSWHIVEGTATCAEGSWSWRYPALTCDESPRLSAWLREVADAVESGPAGAGGTAGPMATLSFLEPNLSLTLVGWARRAALIDVVWIWSSPRLGSPDALRATRTASGARWTGSVFCGRRTTGTWRSRRTPTIDLGNAGQPERGRPVNVIGFNALLRLRGDHRASSSVGGITSGGPLAAEAASRELRHRVEVGRCRDRFVLRRNGDRDGSTHVGDLQVVHQILAAVGLGEDHVDGRQRTGVVHRRGER